MKPFFFIMQFKRAFAPFFAAAFLLFFAQGNAFAQQDHSDINATYTQNFQGLPSNSNFTSNSTLTGWYVSDKNGNNTLMTVSGTGSSSAANLYNFGNSGSTDRALGAVATSTNEYAWGLRMRNSTGQTVNSVTVSFVGEQWRKSDDPEEQLLSFSYKVSGTAITTFNNSEGGYAKVPFLNFISPQYPGGTASALNGELTANRCTITLRFNVQIPNGSEIMFKWLDRNDPDFDHALAIDDVNVTFFTQRVATDEFMGQTPLTHFMKGFIFDIPAANSGEVFNEPTNAQIATWRRAVSNLMNGQYTAVRDSLESGGIGYRITQFSQAAEGSLPARTYYILSKDGLGANHWGTYVFSPNAGRACLTFQAPHPLHDSNTGEQSTHLYRQMDAYLLAVAGAHRCLESGVVACTGSSGPCRNDKKNVISDMAHNTETVFQTTTEVVADARPNERFIQMHGFGQNAVNDTLLVISNGTRLTPANDRAVELGNTLKAAKPTWKFTTPHKQTAFNKFTGLTNVQGRFANAYAFDICSSTAAANAVNGRFLHIEQAPEVRQTSNFATMLSALSSNGICNCNAQINLIDKADDRTAGAVIAPENTLQVRYNGHELMAYLHTAQPSAMLKVTNMMGQTLWQTNTAVADETLVALPTDSFPKGIYVLTAMFGEQSVSEKFMVE